MNTRWYAPNMKKLIRNSLCIALAMTAFGLTACEAGANPPLPPSDDTQYTGYLLAENGSTDYSIVIGTDADKYEKFGAEEMQRLFKEATGATLPIVTDDTVTFSEDAKVISIGDNSFQKASGVTPLYSELKTSGNLVVNKGQSVILTGAYGAGSMYAVYDFLTVLFDYDYYEENAYVIKKINTVELPELNMKNIPDIDKLTFGDRSHYENLGGSVYNAYRQRIYFSEADSALAGHTPSELMPIDTYYDEHPDWYSDRGDQWQLCYTNYEMLEEYVARLKMYLDAKPDTTLISVTDRDYNTWCQCENCTRLLRSYDLYDSNGALLMAAPNSLTGILFKSKAADMVDAWLAEKYPNRHVTYQAHAYFQQRTPPVYRDSRTGAYTLLTNGEENDPLKSVNVNVEWQVAAIEANRNLSWEDNASQGEELKRWAVITPNVIVYDYPQDAKNVLVPYDGIHTHADNMRFAKSLGHTSYKYQGNFNTQSGGFYDLRMYVCSKLAWDLSLDPVELAENYLRVTCGPAYEYMSELYKIERIRMAQRRQESNYGGHCLGDHNKAVDWPREILLTMQPLVDKAYEAIEYIQYEDPVYYAALFRRIKIEELTIQYINLSLYRTYYSTDVKNALIDEFEKYAMMYNATLWSETAPMGDRIAQWRKG